MGSISQFPRHRDSLRPLNWVQTIQDMKPTAHVSKGTGRMQSPHHPNVWIELNYGHAPLLHGANGVTVTLDAVEFSRYLLEWMVQS